jgi:large-conductance mechanosensitive channel
MIKLIVGFIIGAIVMFLVIAVLLIIQDERRIKELKEKARER